MLSIKSEMLLKLYNTYRKVFRNFQPSRDGTRFSEAPEAFRARKALVHLLTEKCVHLKRLEWREPLWITQLGNHKVWDSARPLGVQKRFGTFDKRDPVPKN